MTRPGRLYIGAVIVAGLLVIPFGWAIHPVGPNLVPELVYLAVGVQIAALMPIVWPKGVQSVVDPLLLAAGLAAPGAGVATVAWLAYFDGRRPEGANPIRVVYNKASLAFAHGTTSLAIALLPTDAFWSLPTRTLLYAFACVTINYLLTARVLAFVHGVSTLQVLSENVRLSTIGSTLTLTCAGGILYLLLSQPVGYIMAPGLFGFVLAVRGNVADAQRQSQAREQTLQLAAQALDARDPYTESHSARVGALAGGLGETLQQSARDCDQLRTAGILHDIGKIGIRDNILNKAGPLTPDEWDIMKQHPEIGAEMVSRHSALAALAPAVRHHHERWDGSGYPAGLRGPAIPIGARILAVADSFDTITTPRLYRPTALTADQAVLHISAGAGRWYDPQVVNALRVMHGYSELAGAAATAVEDSERSVSALELIRTNRPFRAFLIGTGISSLGDPLTTAATLVTIYATTHDARVVAVSYALQAAATILMTGVLGGLADRVRRRDQIMAAEFGRALVLFATPFALVASVYCILPILFLLAGLNAVAQPGRQAAIADLVPKHRVGTANAAVITVSMLTGAVGFPLAGLLLWLSHGTTVLFVLDAITFVVAGSLMIFVGRLGGGVSHVPLTSALRRTLSINQARPHLILMALVVVFISMSYPALIALAYSLSGRGPQAYTVLEAFLAVGVVLGSVLVARMKAIGSMRTVAVGLLLTGVMSLGVSLSPSLWVTGIVLLMASIGNPVFAVANQTALAQLASPSNRGAVMASRFGIGQCSLVLGVAIGGVVTRYFGPQATYAILAIGLVVMGLIALWLDHRVSLHPSRRPADVPDDARGRQPVQSAGSAAARASQLANDDRVHLGV